jgi:Polyketide cyclase / dehydrase and lipid transport
MSTVATRPGPPRPPRKPFRKRYAVLLTLLGLLAILLLVAVVRGTWADNSTRDPKSSSEGVICRLYQPPVGDWQVRCSMILDEPPDKVWSVVTDYDNFVDIFPTLESCSAARLYSSTGPVLLSGEAHSAIGTWPFSITVTEEKTPGRYHSYWEEVESGDVTTVEGSWTVTPAGEGKTLLVYTSHIEIKRYPDWVVVNALLFRQPKVMHSVADWLAKSKE